MQLHAFEAHSRELVRVVLTPSHRNIDGGQGLCVGTRLPTEGGEETMKDVGASKPYHFTLCLLESVVD